MQRINLDLEELLKNAQTIGNVIFTTKGIVVIKPYDEPSEVPCEDPHFYEAELIKDLHTIIDLRMQHCLKEFEEHIHDENTLIYPEEAVWATGHFTYVVYKIMHNFQAYPNSNFTDLNNLFGAKNMKCIIHQALKHLHYCAKNQIVITDLSCAQDFLFNKLIEMI